MSRPKIIKGLQYGTVSNILWGYSKNELDENLVNRSRVDLKGMLRRVLMDRDALIDVIERFDKINREQDTIISSLQKEIQDLKETNDVLMVNNAKEKTANSVKTQRLEELDLQRRSEHDAFHRQITELQIQLQDREATISKLREQINNFTRPESKLLENEMLKLEKEACIESVTRQSVAIDRLKREADARNNQIARDGNTIRELHRMIEKKNSELLGEEERIQNQKVLIQRLKHQEKELQEQIVRDGNTIVNLQTEIQELHAQLELQGPRRVKKGPQHSDHPLHHFMVGVSERDVAEVLRKEKTYKGSWMKRGGVGAYMMLARKWDRLESMATEKSYDIFAAINSNLSGDDGTALAEIRDLRRYLMLVESYINSQTCPTTQCPTVEQSAPIEETTTTTPPPEILQTALEELKKSECLPLEFPKDCWGSKTVFFQRPGCTTSAYAQMKNVLHDILALRNVSPTIRHLQEFWNVVNPMIDKWAMEEERALTGHTGTTPPVESWQTAQVPDSKPQIQVLPNGIKPENPDDSNPYLVQELRREPGELESGKGANVPPPTCIYKYDPVTKTWSHICDVDVSTGDMLYLRSVSSPKNIMVTIQGVEEQEDVKRPIGFTDK